MRDELYLLKLSSVILLRIIYMICFFQAQYIFIHECIKLYLERKLEKEKGRYNEVYHDYLEFSSTVP